MPEQFEREYGCSVSEWMQWLPTASGGKKLTMDAVGGRAQIELIQPAHDHHGCLGETLLESTGGSKSQSLLALAWQPLEPRKIALLAIERIHVRFNFSSTTESQRKEFMRHFDLTMQRAGG